MENENISDVKETAPDMDSLRNDTHEVVEVDAVWIKDYKDANYFFYFESGLFFLCFLIGVIISLGFWNLVYKRIG